MARLRLIALVGLVGICAGVLFGPAAHASPSVPIAMSAGSASIVEGDAGTRTVKLAVNLSTASNSNIQVAYTVAAYTPPGGTPAVPSVDFAAKSGTLKFNVSASTGVTPVQQTVSVTIYSDTIAEPTKTFALTLSGLVLAGSPGSTTILNPVGIGTIIDDDPSAVQHADVGDQTIFEGEIGKVHSAQVAVTLSSPATAAASVHYSVAGVTAARNVDFKGPTSGTLNYAIGTIEKTITISIIGDELAEGDETITVTLSAPVGVVLGRAVGTVLIRDTTYRGLASGPKVTVTGDSITYISGPAIQTELASNYQSWITGVPGATMAGMTPDLQVQVASNPHAVVINLGTNDVGADNPNWQADLNTILAATATTACVEFVTLNDTIANYFASLNLGHTVTLGTTINAALHDAANTRANTHLVDWKTAVDADIAPGGPHVLLSDGIHPTAIGQQWLATHIHAALDTDC